MQFEKDNIYHIYNQGNNCQPIFYTNENYLFFLKKIKTHISPFASILAWCLMPNHFHLMVRVNHEFLWLNSEGFAQSEALAMEQRQNSEPIPLKQRTFNDSIGIMLRSYTNAINKQEKRSGALFRKATKAQCLNKIDGITPSFYNTSQGALINIHNPDEDYPNVCFNYIHQNPIKAKLVTNVEDWHYSSYPDVIGLRNGTLIDREVINELGLSASTARASL